MRWQTAYPIRCIAGSWKVPTTTSSMRISHIIDEDRRRNAELFEEAFYEKKNLDPKMREETTTQTVDVPDDVDAELLAKVLANPEMKALLASLAKAMK